jgi:8-oxo-dGTP pyrophosphatase MutT (NUDIX family)
MYKVFYNQRTVLFTDRVEHIKNIDSYIVHNFQNKKKLKKAIGLFKKNTDSETLVVIYENPKKAFKKFKKLHKIIKAGGGLVLNTKNEMLFIYRRDKWDLPKGKLEDKESPEIGALREVEEECGIQDVKVLKSLGATYHTYELNNNSILKKTYWYKMIYYGNEPLVPQTEEEITDAVWLPENQLDKVYENTFPSITEVLKNKDL